MMVDFDVGMLRITVIPIVVSDSLFADCLHKEVFYDLGELLVYCKD